MRKKLLQFATYYSSKNFEVLVSPLDTRTEIVLKMKIGIVSTCCLPASFSFIKTYLPSVLKTQCFNDLNLPFSAEVKNTQLGHLFEHILLTTLCSIKSDREYNGVTTWNWKKDDYGLFRITVDTGYKNEPLIHIALNKTIAFFEKLLVQDVPKNEAHFITGS